MAKNKREIDPTKPDSFYCRQRPKIQQGYWKLFVAKYKISAEVIVECLEELRVKHNTTKKEILDHCSYQFVELITLVSEKTGIKFGSFNKHKDNLNKKYDDSWQRSNLDGSFAYSGVTDDF